MNIKYLEKYYPALECVSFLTMHIQQDTFQSDKTKKLEVIQPTLKLLNQIKDEMGILFDKQFIDKRFLFENLDDIQIWSCAKQIIIYSADFTNFDVEDMFTSIHKKMEEDSLYLLRILSEFDNETGNKVELNETELLQCIQNLSITDEKKWKILQLHLHAEETLNNLKIILNQMLPIYEKYQAQLEIAYQIYIEDMNGHYEEGDMFHHMMKLLDFKLDEGQDVLILPSVSGACSMAITEHQMNPHHTIVILGIGVLRYLEKERELMSVEDICSDLKLLSDKSKFEMLHILSTQRCYGAQLAKQLNLSTPTISYHLQALINAGFLSIEKEDNKIYYQLNEAYLDIVMQQVIKRLKGQ